VTEIKQEDTNVMMIWY